MTRSQLFRERALACLDELRATTDDLARVRLLERAEAWLRLAAAVGDTAPDGDPRAQTHKVDWSRTPSPWTA